MLNITPISNLGVYPFWESARIKLILYYTNDVSQYIWSAVNSLVIIVII